MSTLLSRNFKTSVYGHRGAPSLEPENSLASFRRAVSTGVHGVEFDVRCTLDGVPVVHHDRTLARMFGSDLAIDLHTLRELRSAVADPGLLPTLQEVLSVLPPSVHLDIELKDQRSVDAVLPILRDVERQRFALSSFDWTTLLSARRLLPHAMLWPIATAVTPASLELARQVNAPALSLDYRAFTSVTAAALAQAGLQAVVWTVNDAQTMREMAALGAVVICTDFPDVLLAATTRRSNRPAG